MRTFVATTPDEVVGISRVIHDAWFQRDDVVHLRNGRQIVLPFQQEARAWGGESDFKVLRETWRYKEYRVPFHLGTLTIRHVDMVDVDESWAQMDMLEALDYDETKHEVTLVAFGLLRARVARLEVDAEITPTVAGYVRRRIGKRSRWSSDRPPTDQGG